MTRRSNDAPLSVLAERLDDDLKSIQRAALEDTGLQSRFHDLRHTCVTKLAEGQASEQTLMAIAGHMSRKMLEHYSHIRMEAKRAALDVIAAPVFDGMCHTTGHNLQKQEPGAAG